MFDLAVGTCVTNDTAVDTGVTVIDAPDINVGQSRCVCTIHACVSILLGIIVDDNFIDAFRGANDG